MKNIYTTTLRLNLDNVADREAWEHLQRLDRAQYRSVNRAVISAVNAYFGRSSLPPIRIWKREKKRTLFSVRFRTPSGRVCRQPHL